MAKRRGARASVAAMSANGSELRRRFNSDHKSTKDDLLQDAETQLKRFIETNGHFSLVRYVAYSRSNFHLADAFTLMNGFCGAQSIYMSGRFLVTSDPKYIWYALWFPFFGAIFDFLDGKIARWRRSSSMLGQELDSLADSVSNVSEFLAHTDFVRRCSYGGCFCAWLAISFGYALADSVRMCGCGPTRAL